ncbi:MAG: helix-turn-helix domain-containing protein [Phycisphaerae bacterium]
MAGMFYSLKEAAEKLGVSDEQIKGFVEQGKLREFRDGANLLFKVSEVDALADDTSITASVSDGGLDEDMLLEPVEEDNSQDSLPMEEPLPMPEEATFEDSGKLEPESAESDEDLILSGDSGSDSGLEDDLTNADTQVPEEGINVLDETSSSLKEIDDTLSETASLDSLGTGTSSSGVDEIDGDVNLDTFGSGSGLLDLSLQADDTSLGGILDEIYTPEQDGAAAPIAADASASAAIPADAVAAEAESIADVGLAAAVQQPAAIIQGYVEPEPDASSGWFGMMLFLPFILIIYTALVAIAGLFDMMPTVLRQTRNIMLYVLGGVFVLAFIFMIMGFMAGGSKQPKVKKEKQPKAPKAKKEKPKKEKKAKK